jgi:hypothetical protein
MAAMDDAAQSVTALLPCTAGLRSAGIAAQRGASIPLP